MDVVGAVLAVVVLDEQRRTVQPIVVRLLRIDRAGPREAHLLAPCLTHAPELLVGDLAPHVAGVGLDETERQRARLSAELTERDAGGRLQAVGTAGSAHGIGGGRRRAWATAPAGRPRPPGPGGPPR